MIGVVEGFYGEPWSHNARLDMIRFMGEVGMNSYFYAPKDDPYHRQRWREPYSGEHLERFQELVRVAEDAGIDLYFAISPGLSIKYSSEEDYQALLQKLLSMHMLGIHHVALFLDDVPEELQHPEDKEVFDSLADAHVSLINRLYVELKNRGIALVVCPTTYTDAWGSREYIETLGQGISGEIPLFWTGVDVAISEITADQARFWGGLMNRKPLIWDNFPVNDFEQWRPIIGPLTGRDPDLGKTTTGIVANPMDAPYLSMIPLYTVARYGRRPHSYDARKAWQDALIHLAGADGARALRPLALLFSDYGWTDNVFTPIYTPGKHFNINEVRDALTILEETMEHLRSEQFSDNEYIQHILPELEPFAASIRRDYDDIMSDSFTINDAEGFLIYQIDREAYRVLHTSVRVDGRLNEWDDTEFRYLYSSREGDNNRASIGFRYHEGVLFAGIRVVTDYISVSEHHTWMGGDQVLFAIEFSEDRVNTWIQPTDLLIMVRPPHQNGAFNYLTGSFYLTPFSQRGISDIKKRTISSFFEHFVKDVHPSLHDIVENIEIASTRTSTGYELELAIPVGYIDGIHINASVNDVRIVSGRPTVTNFMFSRRPYIGNPHTWPEIVIR